MALLNSGERAFDYNGNPITPSLVKLAECERRIKQKKQALEDMQNEYNLLEQQAFDTYKNQVNYWYLNAEFAKDAQTWLTMKKNNKDHEGNKLDGRKSYDEKMKFNWFSDRLKELLGLEDFEIYAINEFNFGESWLVYFSSHNHNWQLTIPIIKGIKLKSYQYYKDTVFKLQLHHERSKSFWDWVGSTFDENDLAAIMQEGINKYCEVDE